MPPGSNDRGVFFNAATNQFEYWDGTAFITATAAGGSGSAVLATSVTDAATKSGTASSILFILGPVGGGCAFTWSASGTDDSVLTFPAANGHWVRQWDKTRLNVQWAGAVGDYNPNTLTGTDDTAAINAAIAALPGVANSGGTVFFPGPNWYRCDNPINVFYDAGAVSTTRKSAIILEGNSHVSYGQVNVQGARLVYTGVGPRFIDARSGVVKIRNLAIYYNNTSWRNILDLRTTAASAIVTSATASFAAPDVGKYLSAPGVPPRTTILSVQSGTQVTLSQTAWLTQGRTVTDGVTTLSSSTVTSATAAFTKADEGAQLIGAGIPVDAYIDSYVNATTVTMRTWGSNLVVATATASGVTLKIGEAAGAIGGFQGSLIDFSNFPSSAPGVTTAAGIDNVSTTLTLTGGQGATLPQTTAYYGTIYNATDFTVDTDPNREVVQVTAGFGTDSLTITRARFNTAAVAHNTGGKTYRFAPAVPSGDSNGAAVEQCVIGGYAAGGVARPTTADCGVNFGNVVFGRVSQTQFTGLRYGVRGCGWPQDAALIAGALGTSYYSNGVTIDQQTTFQYIWGAAIINPAQGWTISGCGFEGLRAETSNDTPNNNGMARAIYCDTTGQSVYGLIMSGCWLGDTANSSGPVIWLHNGPQTWLGCAFIGNQFGATSGSETLRIESQVNGLVFQGNTVSTHTGVELISNVNRKEGILIQGNDFSSCLKPLVRVDFRGGLIFRDNYAPEDATYYNQTWGGIGRLMSYNFSGGTTPLLATVNTSGVDQMGFDPQGLFTFYDSALTATTATAGANGAPPAQVVGYGIIMVAGTKRKIAYYAL